MYFPRMFAAFAASITLGSAAIAAERTIIVLDASGSMWGQIAGKAKIEIAREALDRVVTDYDPTKELGLLVYGHREKGQCKDIELVVPAQAGAASLINQSVGKIKPKGKTPLTASVRQAAESLKFTEDKATVVLITDGLETCNADPCALARELEETGVDFTAHVVGFGLSKEEGREVACLADETGGVYLSAADATELQEALNETVQAEAPVEEEAPVEVTASLTAPDSIEITKLMTVGWEGPGDKFDRIQIHDPNANSGEGKVIRIQTLHTTDVASRELQIRVPASPGLYELRYYHSNQKKFLAVHEFEATPVEVAILAPDSVPIAKMITVEWIGPGAKYDSIWLWDPSAKGGEGRKVREVRLRQGDFEKNALALPAPGKPGTYELWYWNGDDKTALATRPLEVTDALVQMETEPPHAAGSMIKIDWIGPGARYDEVQLWDPQAKGGDGKKLFSKRLRQDDFDNQQVTLPAPAEAGAYELRYWNGDNNLIIASQPIDIDEVEVSLVALDQIEAARPINVIWEGPGARYDEVQLWDLSAKGGEGKKLFSKRVRQGDFENKAVTLPGPANGGEYELRYYNGDSRLVMVTRPITVQEAVVSLEAKDRIGQGYVIKVDWQGPGARYDEVHVWDPNAKGGEGKKLFSVRVRNDDFENQKVTLPSPVKPGFYELLYYNGDNRKVMATRQIEIVPIDIGIEAPEAVEVETKFAVTWQGPGARYDEIQIWDPNAKGGEGKKLTGRRLRNDDYDNNKVTIKAPDKPGTYQLRYYNGDNRAVLAEREIAVQ